MSDQNRKKGGSKPEKPTSLPSASTTPRPPTSGRAQASKEVPRLVGDDLVELTSGVRITDEIVKTLGRTKSYRAIADLFGVTYLELEDAVSLFRSGTLYSQTDTDL